ncbi:facilitated trehalose transporter Tret1-like isoform X2 [Lycorma delicatula]
MEAGNTLSSYGVKATLIQVGLCLVISIAQLTAGMTMGFSAVTLPYMNQQDSNIHVTSGQASWIASLAAITLPVGCLVSGPILDRWGRKSAILLINLPAFVGWLLIAIQPNLWRIYIGRALTGFASGLSSIPATVYFAEISTKSMRGFLISGTSLSISTGVLIVYILGYYLQDDWRMVATICAVFPVTSAILIAVLVPESPQWLISKACNKEASTALQRIRGVSASKDIQQELDSIMDQNRLLNRRNKTTFKELIHTFTLPQVYKPFFIMNIFFFFQQFSGIFVIIFYAIDVVRNSGILVDPFVVSIMIAIIRLVFTLLAAWGSKQFGRRIPAIFSGCGMTISLLILTYHLNSNTENVPETSTYINKTVNLTGMNNSLVETTSNVSSISWVPLLSILFYVLSSTVGFLTLPWAMVGEVFPTQVRGVACGLTTCFAYIISFITVKSYPLMMEIFHQHGVYMVFCVMAFIGTVFVIFFLPETQGKTLREIEQYFIKSGAEKRASKIIDDSQETKIMLSNVTVSIVQSKAA